MALTVYVCLLPMSVWNTCGVGWWGLQTVSSHANLRSNDSRRLYDANVILDVRRTADASRLSQGFRAQEPSVDPPDPTSVSDRHRKQTDTQSMPSALSVVRGNECKIIVNEKMRFSFACPMLDLLPLEIINYYTNYVLQQSTKSTASHRPYISHNFPFDAASLTIYCIDLNTVTR